VLLITPRVIRNIERPGARLEEFNSGTEYDIGRGGSASPVPVTSQPQIEKQPAIEGPRPPAAGPQPKEPAQKEPAQKP